MYNVQKIQDARETNKELQDAIKRRLLKKNTSPVAKMIPSSMNKAK